MTAAIPLYIVGRPTGTSSSVCWSVSARALIPLTDAGYLAWIAMNAPGSWPVDATQTQTYAALDAVLMGNGLALSGEVPLTQAQLFSYAGSKVTALMAIPRTYSLPGSLAVKSDGTASTGADLAGLNAWGTASPTATTTWVDDFGVATTITGAQGCALAAGVIAYGQSVYNMLGTAATGITSSAITTTAEIDALAWPT